MKFLFLTLVSWTLITSSFAAETCTINDNETARLTQNEVLKHEKLVLDNTSTNDFISKQLAGLSGCTLEVFKAGTPYSGEKVCQKVHYQCTTTSCGIVLIYDCENNVKMRLFGWQSQDNESKIDWTDADKV